MNLCILVLDNGCVRAMYKLSKLGQTDIVLVCDQSLSVGCACRITSTHNSYDLFHPG